MSFLKNLFLIRLILSSPRHETFDRLNGNVGGTELFAGLLSPTRGEKAFDNFIARIPSF